MADASKPVAALLPALEESAWEERAVRALARSPAARALEAAWAAAEGVELVVEPEAWEPEGVALVAPSVSLSAAPPLSAAAEEASWALASWFSSDAMRLVEDNVTADWLAALSACALVKPPTVAESGVVRLVRADVEAALVPDALPEVSPAAVLLGLCPSTPALVVTVPLSAVPVDRAVLMVVPACRRGGQGTTLGRQSDHLLGGGSTGGAWRWQASDRPAISPLVGSAALMVWELIAALSPWAVPLACAAPLVVCSIFRPAAPDWELPVTEDEPGRVPAAAPSREAKAEEPWSWERTADTRSAAAVPLPPKTALTLAAAVELGTSERVVALACGGHKRDSCLLGGCGPRRRTSQKMQERRTGAAAEAESHWHNHAYLATSGIGSRRARSRGLGRAALGGGRASLRVGG